MTELIKIKHASVAIHGAEACSYLADLVLEGQDAASAGSINKSSCADLDNKLATGQVDLELFYSDKGLQLLWHNNASKPLKFNLDFEKTASQLRSFPAPKQGAFNQALGKKTKTVIDATGGWGGDALLMSLQGYHVTIIERLPLMATLLTEAFDRFATSPWAVNNNIVVPRVLSGGAVSVLQDKALTADCVYLDPMFPPKRKKTAASNKQMQLLQWLAGADNDASELANYVASKYSRLAVKRPDHAKPLLPLQGQNSPTPSVQFSSKLVHYDVYLNLN